LIGGMLNFTEFRKTADRISDLINWAGMVDESVVLNKDGSLQTTLQYRGPDLDSATESELVSTSARLNNVLRRLGKGWAIYAEAQRRESKTYPKSHFPDPVTRLIDEERKASFQQTSHFESFYYLTFIYMPSSETENKVGAFFLEKSDKFQINYQDILKSFKTEVDRALRLIASIFPEAKLLVGEEVLTYLHSTVSEKRHKIKLPEINMYLDSLLCDSALVPGFEPRLGKSTLGVIAVKGFPGRSQPGLLDRLNRLSIEYRWVTRYIFLDKTDAESEIGKYKKKWFAKRKGIVTLLKETLTGSQSVMEDSDAVNKALDADEALQELSDDAVSYGYFTACIVLLNEDAKTLINQTREVEKTINAHGFSTKHEDVNAVDAWLGTIPGNCRNNVRRPLLNTLNLAHLMPLSAVWAGPEKDSHLDAPPLLYARTNGSTQFRYSLHVGDVGHSLVIGPTGSGKSVLLNMIAAQFRRYRDSQVYIFDKGGSARTLTHAVGGEYYDLGADENSLNFQPLSNIEIPSELRWAHEWVLDILVQENVSITPSLKEKIWTALNSLVSAPKEERTIFGLTLLIQDEELRNALLPYTVEGPHGHLLDNSFDNLRYGNWQCFEMEVLMETQGIVLPVLSFLFHRLQQRFTGMPTLLILDEAWLFLDNKAFAAKIREWLKVLRKSNVSVIFATQSLADVDASSIATTIKEACLTKIYLPNSSALNEDIHAFYRRFGLNDTQIRILAEAIPKRNYYYTSAEGNRLFELSLDEMALLYCGSTTKENQALVRKIASETETTEDFNRKYLIARGAEWAVKLHDEFLSRTNLQKK